MYSLYFMNFSLFWQVRLYIVPGVPEKTVFQPQTRGEIKVNDNDQYCHDSNKMSSLSKCDAYFF